MFSSTLQGPGVEEGGGRGTSVESLGCTAYTWLRMQVPRGLVTPGESSTVIWTVLGMVSWPWYLRPALAPPHAPYKFHPPLGFMLTAASLEVFSSHFTKEDAEAEG